MPLNWKVADVIKVFISSKLSVTVRQFDLIIICFLMDQSINLDSIHPNMTWLDVKVVWATVLYCTVLYCTPHLAGRQGSLGHRVADSGLVLRPHTPHQLPPDNRVSPTVHSGTSRGSPVPVEPEHGPDLRVAEAVGQSDDGALQADQHGPAQLEDDVGQL